MNDFATKLSPHRAERSLSVSYFDASAWSDLVRNPACESIVADLRRSRVTVLASVISAAEILKTRNADLRRRLCSLILNLHGGGPLLERPMTLAADAARTFLQDETDFILPRTGPGRSLLEFLHRPAASDEASIRDWLQNLDRNHNRFLDEIRPEEPNRTTRYYSPEIMRSEPFLRLLAELPAAQELSLSLEQVALLNMRVDVWRAVAATLGYIVTQGMVHTPKQGGKRPGGPDMWQVVYLGVAEAFVSSDVRLLEAASEVSSTLRYPRCVVSTRDFFYGIVGTPGADKSRCWVCGSSKQAGTHAFDREAVASL